MFWAYACTLRVPLVCIHSGKGQRYLIGLKWFLRVLFAECKRVDKRSPKGGSPVSSAALLSLLAVPKCPEGSDSFNQGFVPPMCP